MFLRPGLKICRNYAVNYGVFAISTLTPFYRLCDFSSCKIITNVTWICKHSCLSSVMHEDCTVMALIIWSYKKHQQCVR